MQSSTEDIFPVGIYARENILSTEENDIVCNKIYKMRDVFKVLEGIVLRETGSGGLNEKVRTAESVNGVVKREDGSEKKVKGKK